MANLIEIKKDLYRPHPSMANMTRRQADELRHRNNTKVEGGVVVVPNPVEHFEHCFDSAPLGKMNYMAIRCYCFFSGTNLFCTIQ